MAHTDLSRLDAAADDKRVPIAVGSVSDSRFGPVNGPAAARGPTLGILLHFQGGTMRRFALVALSVGLSIACGDDASFDGRRAPTITNAVTSTTTLTSIADTHVRSGSPNANYGTTTTLIVEKSGSKRALAKFDTAAIQAALVGRTLVSASLELTIQGSASGFPTGGANLAAHKITQNWTEGGATWNCAIDTLPTNGQPNCTTDSWSMGAGPNPWSTPGVTTLIVSGQSGVIAFNVTSDVGAFVAGTATNYGWLVKKENEALTGTVTFRSRQGTVPPSLVLTVAGPCGDGTVDALNNEACDDGNTVPGDGCNETCVVEFCGDGTVNNTVEGCDDGNTTPGDGCSEVCAVEYCGDGVVNNGAEGCDDGNTTPGDGCSEVCAVEYCGDGVVNNGGVEVCDDANSVEDDGCFSDCSAAEDFAASFTGAWPGSGGPYPFLLRRTNGLVVATTWASATTFNPATNAWTLANPPPNYLAYACQAQLPNERILVAGGNSGTTAAQIFDAATGTWAATGNLTSSRTRAPCLHLDDGRVLLVGGIGPATAEVFNPATGTWSTTSPATSGHADARPARLPDGKVLFADGSHPDVFDPQAATFSRVDSGWAGRGGHVVVALADGRVLVAGGYGSGNAGSTAIFDPDSEVWSAAAGLLTPRSRAAAVLLPSGHVLIAGGRTADGSTSVADAEVYNPDVDAWSPSGTLLQAREDHSMILLPENVALVVGGYYRSTTSSQTLGGANGAELLALSP